MRRVPGKRFNKETLAVEYRGKNISQILEMTIEEALEFLKYPGAAHQAKDLKRCGPDLY